MNDICRFIPTKEYSQPIQYYHFVYESGTKELGKPFFFSKYRMVLVAKGSGSLRTREETFPLEPGTLFFTFPQHPCQLRADSGFAYLYISCDGADVASLLKKMGVDETRPVYPDFGHVYEFWMNAIRRINPGNAAVLTESVFMYTLSYLSQNVSASSHSHDEKFSCILEYIHNNYTDPNLTLQKVADVFFYSEKYFSSLFVKKMDLKFTAYLNNLRIRHAKKLLEERDYPISTLAAACGYSDAFYFSKVFRRQLGKTPAKYREEMQDMQQVANKSR